jgi:hypothetical protein
MPQRLKIPPELLILNPTLTLREIRAIIMVILSQKSQILRQSNVVDFKIPGIGRIKSHGNRKKKGISKRMAKDRRRKKLQKREKDLQPHKLLF